MARKRKKPIHDDAQTQEWKQYKDLLDKGISPDGLPINPFPPGPSAGIMKCEKYPKGKERFWIEKPGWYKQKGGWFRVTKRS